MKTITNEKEYRDICQQMNIIIDKGTEFGDMERLPETDKNEYIRLSEMVRKWESVVRNRRKSVERANRVL